MHALNGIHLLDICSSPLSPTRHSKIGARCRYVSYGIVIYTPDNVPGMAAASIIVGGNEEKPATFHGLLKTSPQNGRRGGL